MLLNVSRRKHAKVKRIRFFKNLNNTPKTIITTAYKEHALEGFELNVVDYILKPFSFERFVKAVNKVSDLQTTKTVIKEVSSANYTSTRFFVKGDKKHHQIDLSDLLYIEAYGNYTKLFLKDEMIVSHAKISHYEAILTNANFLRVHKYFIVAVDKIKFIEGNRILITEHKIPIGQTYKNNINNLFTL
jgi:DNA-binding LytR/AlgR family response regulator